jgi:hypothetical protein
VHTKYRKILESGKIEKVFFMQMALQMMISKVSLRKIIGDTLSVIVDFSLINFINNNVFCEITKININTDYIKK